MRIYEILFFTRPDIEEEKLGELISKYQEVITNAGGTVKTTEKWGKRRLAYEINDLREGLYVLLTFEGPGTLPKEIDRMMGIDQDILRHMISRIDGLKRQVKPAKTVPLAQGAVQVQKGEDQAPILVEKEAKPDNETVEKRAESEAIAPSKTEEPLKKEEEKPE